MTAYKDADLINRLLSKIPQDWGVYIHIDKKSSMQIDDIQHENVHVEKTFRIFWGGGKNIFSHSWTC